MHGLLGFNVAECKTPDVSFGSGVFAGGGQTHVHAHVHKPVFVYKIMKVAWNSEGKKPLGRPRHTG